MSAGARVVQISVSPGGVPKEPVARLTDAEALALIGAR